MSEHEYAPNLDEPLEVTGEAANYNGWIYDRARPYLGRRVLDLGAGIGTFTRLAAEDGRDVVALEPHPQYAELLEGELAASTSVEVVRGTAEELRDSGPAPFDAAMCFNVLEHIRDDRSALAAARDLLVPGGHLLLLVPAHRLLYGEVDRRIGHERRYSRGEVRRLAREAGLEVRTARYVNPLGALGWLVTFRLRRPERWPRGQYRLFDALVPGLRLLDRLPIPFGLSVWLVARRPLSS
jgi:SAM-dependent methyltransferase